MCQCINYCSDHIFDSLEHVLAFEAPSLPTFLASITGSCTFLCASSYLSQHPAFIPAPPPGKFIAGF